MSLIQSHEEQPVLNLYYLVEVPKAGVMLDTLNKSLSESWDAFQESCKSNNIRPHVHMYQYDTDCVKFFDSFEQEFIPPVTPSSASKTVLSPALELLHKEMMQQYSIPCRKVPHFYPIVILMSCSHIQDDFENQYHALWSYYWYANATKIGFAIGDSADWDMLVDMTGTAEAVISSTNLELFSRLLRFRCLADEDCDIEVLLDDIASFESKYTPTKHPKACSRLKSIGHVVVDFVNGTSQDILPGQEAIVMKGQVMPCASPEEYMQKAFIFSNDQGICLVSNVSGHSLNAHIILNPGDSFLLEGLTHIYPSDDNPMFPCSVDNVDTDFGICEDAFRLSVSASFDQPDYVSYMSFPFGFGQIEVKRCELGLCPPNLADETVFSISKDEDKYRMTNVSSYTFSVSKEFRNGGIIVLKSGGKIAEYQDHWQRNSHILMEVSISPPQKLPEYTEVPQLDNEDWDDW